MNTLPIRQGEIKKIADAFIHEAGILLRSAGLEIPEESMPSIKISHMQVRCYDPGSGIHDFDPQKHYGYLEALGAYYPGDEDKPESRQLLIFPHHILQVAELLTTQYSPFSKGDKEFDKDLPMSFDRIVNLVICHEIAHWLFHRTKNEQGKTLGMIHYVKNDAIFFHEALAQSLVWEIFKKSLGGIPTEEKNYPSMKTIMAWMESGQPQQYIAYKRLGERTDIVLQAFGKLMSSGLQSFEILEQTVKQISKGENSEYESIFEKFLLNPFTPIFQEESMPEVAAYLRKNLPNLEQKFRGSIYGQRYHL